MAPQRLRLLLGSFALGTLVLAAPHKQISGMPPEVAQENVAWKEQTFLANETSTSEKNSAFGDLAEKSVSRTWQGANGGAASGDQPSSGGTRGAGEMADFKVEADRNVNPAPAEELRASPAPSGRLSEVRELVEEEDGDEEEGDYAYGEGGEDDAEAEEAQEADDDYDAAEAAAEDDDGDGGGGDN